MFDLSRGLNRYSVFYHHIRLCHLAFWQFIFFTVVNNPRPQHVDIGQDDHHDEVDNAVATDDTG